MNSTPRKVVLMLMTLCVSLAAFAADPQPYRVELASTSDGAMDETLRATSDLVSLRESAPVSPFALIARARGDVERLKTVVESYGYYHSTVTITIDGQGLSSPGLVDGLMALPKDHDARVAVNFVLGPLYHLRKVSIDGSVPQSAASALSLNPGAPAIAADVVAAGARIQSALQEQGYAFAKVDPPLAYEDPILPELDVIFHVDSGAQVKIGDIRIEGLQRVHENLARRRLLLHSGQLFRPSAIEAARRDLLSLGPFASINVQVGAAGDAAGGVPITFVIGERRRHAVALNAAYSTDLGGSGGIVWTDRNVFGNAEQLKLAASVINAGGNSSTGLGYDTSAKLIIPDFGHRDQSLQVAVGAIKQSLQAYDQSALTAGVTLARKLSSVWSASAGIAASDEKIKQEGVIGKSTGAPIYGLVTYNYTLVALPLTLSYDSTHLASPLDDPTHGMRDSFSITPTQSLGHPSASFIISQVKLAAYFDLHSSSLGDAGRSVLAVRALAGQAQGAGEFSLPPDQRFYGGGSGTIRGYAYQSVGPTFAPNAKFPTSIPIGGTAIVAGSLEMRRRFGESWGAALFVDGGQVSASLKPLPADFRLGVGGGVRYYTPIGPIRVDIAVPTKPIVGFPRIEVYIGLGQAF